MIYYEDSFLALEYFNKINNFINSQEFIPVDVGDAFFYV